MLGNYKKVAIINPNKIIKNFPNHPYDITIPVNLQFNPSRVLVKFILRQNHDYVGGNTVILENSVIDSKYHNVLNINPDEGTDVPKVNSWDEPKYLIMSSTEMGASITKKTNSQIVIRFNRNMNMSYYDVKIQEIIAIE